jgi:ABC-type dipeptide/oligopeptide/nickel transport system permease component
MVWSDMLPWYYTPKFILMTIPLAVIVGFVLSLFFSWRKNQSFYYAIVLFACVFPIFWLGYSDANVYGGWRHAMFAYPPMVVCAGLGFNGLFEWINSKIKNQKFHHTYFRLHISFCRYFCSFLLLFT